MPVSKFLTEVRGKSSQGYPRTMNILTRLSQMAVWYAVSNENRLADFSMDFS
ncbi:uncharacterized protein METZ01_LOCUS316571, partial [marine metagenome]